MPFTELYKIGYKTWPWFSNVPECISEVSWKSVLSGQNPKRNSFLLLALISSIIEIQYHRKKKIIIISRSLLQPKKERDCLQTALLLAIPETEFWASNYKATICWKGLNHGGRKKWVKELVRSETPLQVAGHPALCRKSNSLACTKTKKSVLQPISRS